MSKFIIQGGTKLRGEISVMGAKNNALKVIPATLLTKEKVILHNVPDIVDVDFSLQILESLGAKIEKLKPGSFAITCKDIDVKKMDKEVAKKIRTSIMFVAPLIHRFKTIEMPHPGGCIIGKRPIDIFVDFLEELGVKVDFSENHYTFTNNGIKGKRYTFTTISHTGTESLMLAAVLANGKTEIVNAACEPEVEALAQMLNSMGAKIKGAGTPYIEIIGVKKLNGTEFTIIPDRIEAGSFLCVGVATNSPLRITNCEPKHLEIPIKLLQKMGVELEIGKNYIQILKSNKLNAINIATHEYPGFPTDLQSCYIILLTQAKGTSIVHETIFEGRLYFTDLLSRMGANIVLCDPHRAVITGPTKLVGKRVESPDIRAGLAMLIASLIAEGTSEVDNIQQIDRGYQKIDERLNNLGAKIQRIEI